MALKQQATVIATTTQEVKLEPRLRLKLQKQLKEYQQLTTQLKDLKERVDRKKASLGGLREQTGEQSIQLDGFTVTEVRGTSKKLDKKKFVALGGSLAQLEGATVESPKRPYELITCPGEREESDDE